MAIKNASLLLSNKSFEQRQAMVSGVLKTNGVIGDALETAFLSIDRRFFVPATIENPYVDQTILMNDDRMIFNPLTLGTLIKNLSPLGDKNILVIAGNYGYSAAILQNLCQSVCVVEDDVELYQHLKSNLGDRLPTYPRLDDVIDAGLTFDIIIIEGAVERLNKNLLNLLNEDGCVAALLPLQVKNICQIAILTPGDTGMSSKIIGETTGVVLPPYKKDEVFEF
jgi:protein-L-isoaspartate(D-aspartate) O-methyltransferase